MRFKKLGLGLAIIASAMLWCGHPADATEISELYIKALNKNDKAALDGIVKYKKAAIPGEIDLLIKQAKGPDLTKEEKESLLYVAEHMAIKYKDITGDFAPLIEVKKRTFDAKLSAPVMPEMKDGVRIVDIPLSTEDTKNIFVPDNIVVKLGDTVRWTNSDTISHVFSTMGTISAGKFYASDIPAGESWDFTFEKPGEYFYICYIHQSMIGKVTVEGPSEEGAAEAAPAAAEAPADKEASAEKDTPDAATAAPADDAGADKTAPAPPTNMTTE